jgi:hypothetical protein
MTPFKLVKPMVLLAFLSLLAPSAFGQSSRTREVRRDKGLRSTTSLYTPRVIGRSSAFVVEGVIISFANQVITVKTDKGERYVFFMDDHTLLLGSDHLVSIATLADIELRVTDLRVSDRIEIVAERAARRSLAKIITRIAPGDERVARALRRN